MTERSQGERPNVSTRRGFLAAGAAAAAAALACAGLPARARAADKFRTFCSANPLPVGNAPPADRAMFEEFGFEPVALCDHGSLNRMGVFLTDDGRELTDTNQFRWERDVDRSDPAHAQHEWAVRNYARMCRDRANKHRPWLPGTLPMYFNLEVGKWSLDVMNDPQRDRKLDEIMGNWLKVVRWSKESTGGLCPVSAYMLPVAYQSDTAQELARELAYAMPSLYMIDEYLPNPNLWFDVVDQTEAVLSRHYPWLPRVAVINPTWQVYRKPEAQAKWNGKPIGLPLWARQLRHLADRGWTGALCWWGFTTFDATTKQYIKEMDQMQR